MSDTATLHAVIGICCFAFIVILMALDAIFSRPSDPHL